MISQRNKNQGRNIWVAKIGRKLMLLNMWHWCQKSKRKLSFSIFLCCSLVPLKISFVVKWPSLIILSLKWPQRKNHSNGIWYSALSPRIVPSDVNILSAAPVTTELPVIFPPSPAPPAFLYALFEKHPLYTLPCDIQSLSHRSAIIRWLKKKKSILVFPKEEHGN